MCYAVSQSLTNSMAEPQRHVRRTALQMVRLDGRPRQDQGSDHDPSQSEQRMYESKHLYAAS